MRYPQSLKDFESFSGTEKREFITHFIERDNVNSYPAMITFFDNNSFSFWSIEFDVWGDKIIINLYSDK